MPELKLGCPSCKKLLQIKVAAQQSSVKIRCPHCQREFKANIPGAGGAVPQTATFSQHEPFANLNDPALLPPSHFASSNYQGPSMVKRKSTGTSKAIWWIGGAVAGVLTLVVAAVTLWTLLPSNFVSTLTGKEVVSDEESLGPPIPALPWRSENVDDLAGELGALANQTQTFVSALAEAELATRGVERLKAASKQFEDMFYRIVNATPKSIDLKAVHEQERALQQALNGSAPAEPSLPVNYIWNLGGAGDREDPWKMATREVSESRMKSEGALSSRVQYPDPLKETSGVYDWSTEDRRVLSAYWLQGELQRDVATELLACLREKVSAAELEDRCGEVVDRYVPRAIELAKVLSAQGTLMIQVPKNTVYERHAISTRLVLQQLKELHAHPAIGGIIKETIDVSEAIEDIQFQRGGRLLDYAKTSTRARLAAIRDAEQKQKQKLAEEEQARQREIQLATERAAKKDAEEKERRRQAAELALQQQANQIQENQTQNNPSQDSSGRSSVPGSESSVPFGPPIGMRGGPFGPRGGADMSQNPAFPQGPPFGSAPREAPAAGSNPADADQPSFTIRIAKATEEQYQQAVEAVKALSGNYQTSNSNGKIELKIFKYSGSLADLEAKLPMLKFDKTDEATKTVDASFR